jgi:hypothetical protein
MGIALPILLCPSSECARGSQLIGVTRHASEAAGGMVSLLAAPIEVDEAFVAALTAPGRRRPETRLRFARPCPKAGCAQWRESGCGIVTSLLQEASDVDPRSTLPECGIRQTCRWFVEGGGDACRLCEHVITALQ